jgi:hypothetical protein
MGRCCSQSCAAQWAISARDWHVVRNHMAAWHWTLRLLTLSMALRVWSPLLNKIPAMSVIHAFAVHSSEGDPIRLNKAVDDIFFIAGRCVTGPGLQENEKRNWKEPRREVVVVSRIQHQHQLQGKGRTLSVSRGFLDRGRLRSKSRG